MKNKKCLVIGKFRPFHKGHEFIIENALTLGQTFVLAADRDYGDYTLADRKDDILDTFAGRNIMVKTMIDRSPMTKYDVDDIATSVEFWDYWIDAITQTFGNYVFDYVLTSDKYGRVLAEKLGAVWVPIDTNREIFKTSGTDHRNDLRSNWTNLPRATRLRFSKKIAVLGPESSGKTTLVNYIIDKYGICDTMKPVYEYGRTISVAKNHELTPVDFELIFKLQQAQVDMVRNGEDVPLFVISDTEAFTTKTFLDIYGVDLDVKSMEDEYITNDDYDLYVILAPVIKWTDDGERKVPDDEVRRKMFDSIVEYVIVNKKNYIIIKETDMYERGVRMWSVMNQLLPRWT